MARRLQPGRPQQRSLYPGQLQAGLTLTAWWRHVSSAAAYIQNEPYIGTVSQQLPVPSWKVPLNLKGPSLLQQTDVWQRRWDFSCTGASEMDSSRSKETSALFSGQRITGCIALLAKAFPVGKEFLGSALRAVPLSNSQGHPPRKGSPNTGWSQLVSNPVTGWSHVLT